MVKIIQAVILTERQFHNSSLISLAQKISYKKDTIDITFFPRYIVGKNVYTDKEVFDLFGEQEIKIKKKLKKSDIVEIILEKKRK